ncbi:MAG TPA: glycosyltransferase [Rhizomicrobium sp.]|nr:glycosyltransferase [Rhizomicrobium sp.]
MTAALICSLAAAVWWLCSAMVLSFSFVAALLHPIRRAARTTNGLPPLTAIVPIKTVHDGFAEAQSSLFSQNYDSLEILVAAAEPVSPAFAALRDLHGGVTPRIVISDCKAAASPKLNNLWPAICQAENDVVLTKDSNILLHQGDAAALVQRLGSGIGLVSAIPIARQLLSFPAWIEASIINCYHARVLMLGDAVGVGFGLGKIMLFRRSDLLRAGGFDAIKWAVGEDMALARAMRRLGLRIVLADRSCDQILGHRLFGEVWRRQLRWMTIWRVQLPAAFYADLLGSALPTALAGAVAAHLIGLSPAFVFATTFAGWCAIECLLCVFKDWPISFWSPLAFLARELFTPALWLHALITNEVQWAGATYRVCRHITPFVAQFEAESGTCARGGAE